MSRIVDTNHIVVLPRASSFNPRVRIIAWADSSAVRRRFICGSEGLRPPGTTPDIPTCTRIHDSILHSPLQTLPKRSTQITSGKY